MMVKRLALVSACILGSCNARREVSAELAAPTPIPVRVVPIEAHAVRVPIRAFGTLGAQQEMSLAFKVGGLLRRVTVEEGERVEKGQLLARIDDTELRAEHKVAVHELEKAKRDLARLENLYRQDSAALVSIQDAETRVALTTARVSAVAFNHRQTNLLAPASGVIARRAIDAGEFVAPGQLAFALDTTGGGPVVRVALVDRDVLDVRVGARAEVRLDVLPGKTLDARVSQVVRAASPSTGTFPVELTVDDPSAAELPSGLSAKVEIERVDSAAVSVPVSALVDANGQTAALYVLDGNHAKRVPVTLRAIANDRALLVDSLAGLTRVIDTGAPFLEDGALVSVVP